MILFLTNADTEILSLRVVAEQLPEGFPELRAANPALLDEQPDLEGVDVVLVRLLGGRRAWEAPFDRLRDACVKEGRALLAFGGEAVPDGDLTQRSTVPSAIVAQAFAYLTQGGVANLANLLRFVADTVLMEGFGFEPPALLPPHGVYRPPEEIGPGRDGEGPRVGVVFYRAHVLAGNTRFVDELCAGIRSAGGVPFAVYGYSLRPDGGFAEEPEASPVVNLLAGAGVDVVVVTMLASGALDDTTDSWDAGALAGLDVPIVQGICATQPGDRWDTSNVGLCPIDVAMAVAIPEFDGRIISVPFSFKETVDADDVLGTPVTAYRTRPDRVVRLAELAVRLGRLRRVRPVDKRVAIVLSAYPTKRSRLGNAVGLDTPASVVGLLSAMAAAGYRVDRIPESGDALMAELADTLTYDTAETGPMESARAAGHWPAPSYIRWFESLPPATRSTLVSAWGPPPGSVHVDVEGDAGAHGPSDVHRAVGRLVFSGIDLGGVLVAIQPPRGFGDNPVAIYHSPDLPPTHHYLGFYRWLDESWGADAVVHMGKHGTLEWLPGKSVGLSGACFPDAAIGSIPFIYPFVVNDPGEGTQAKRRAHAVIIDHLVPPLARAELTDDLVQLESLLDTHAQVSTLDPGKLPEIRRQVWEVLVAAEIHRDLGMSAEAPGGGGRDQSDAPSFDDPAFDDVLVEVDGYLCELKDAQIRGGLHILGEAPTGDALVEMVLAITRLPQLRAPSLRREVATSFGVHELDDPRHLDRIEVECRRRVEVCARVGWSLAGLDHRHDPDRSVRDSAVLPWVCGTLVPALAATSGEIGAVLAALEGRFVSPGPSGAPSRGMAHVLPTGRNFYSVDPKAIPSPLAWQVGSALADRLIERHVAEEGRPPTTVGLVVWGTAAMRTAGDDIAEILALLGVRPLWAEESGRVVGLELIPMEELGRPRVDVTVRVSGFFRDAFPHVLGLMDDAFALAVGADDPPGTNPLAEAGIDEPRMFGPKPGAYGAGILALLESRNWRSDDDLAQVYVAWGGYGYRRPAGGGAVEGAAAPDALRRRLATVEVAVKNQDNREHDIFDSDDYLQEHGGMVAAIRSITGVAPKAWFGDSSDPGRPRVRSLAEEAARVVRSRVVNPRWLAAMQRHGYKGAFEMAATVDYLFGYDATAGVVEDWMYERVTRAYVADPATRKFFEVSNPWALRSIAERLLEASERGLWEASAEALGVLRSAVLEAEGWEEDR